MSFFDFIDKLNGYPIGSAVRLNLRFKHIVEPFQADLQDARVLDIAAHDGRWSYALASVGAASVLGIEGRPKLIEKFQSFPETTFKSKVSLKANDLFEEVRQLSEAKRFFDVVALFGIFYHIMDHLSLLKLISELKPKLIIVDGEFMITAEEHIQLVKERTDNVLNAISAFDGQEFAVVGIPSVGAMEQMADAVGYNCSWTDWSSVPITERGPVKDYFREGNKQRRTCSLRPIT